MQGFIAATQFLTRLPIGTPGIFAPRRMLFFFPAVGLVLGALVAVCDFVTLKLWPTPIAALLDVLLLIYLTGALHLDGIADTADGLYGQRNKERALAIMKDSRVGAMGVVAVFCVLAVKWAGIAHLTNHRSLALLIIPAYARAGMLFGICLLPYGRSHGTGRAFFETPLQWRTFALLLLPVGLSLGLGGAAIVLNLGFVVITGVLVRFYHKKIGVVTGDLLGAMAEINEAGLFLLMALEGVT